MSEEPIQHAPDEPEAEGTAAAGLTRAAEHAHPAAEPAAAPVPEAAQGEPVAESSDAVAAPAAQPAAADATAEPKSVTAPVAATGKEAPGKPRKTKLEENLFPFSVTVGKVYDGPMDLLLDLIRKQDIDIWDIPIAKITAQFLAYVEKLKETDVDNAGEFIYTASLLIHIKSRMLLPREPAAESGEEPDDPRRELVERLLEHERFKNAAQMLLQKQQIEAAVWTRPQLRSFLNDTDVEGEIAADVPDLVRAFRDILDRLRNRPVLNVAEDSATVGQMIDYVRRRLLLEDRPVSLSKLLSQTRSERGLIALFLALLEMVRLQAILLRQDGNFSEVYVKKQDGFESLMENKMREMQDDWH